MMPDVRLAVAAARRQGWAPRPFQEALLKLVSRCNLACDYCYIYTAADRSWRMQPPRMSPRVLDRAALRIAQHARHHGLSTIRVVLHGGEPLLAGQDAIAAAAARLRASTQATLEFSIQTNGVLLDTSYLDTLAASGIRIGVSLDGGPREHDRHRRYTSGRPSHAAAAAALRLLATPGYRDVYGGILCTVDLHADPIEGYEALLEYTPPAIDFLLPHGTWTAPPPGRTADPASTPYADWLIPIFDRWFRAARRPTRVRLFEEIIQLALGGDSRSEIVGLNPQSLIVVETDGSLRASDALSVAGENVLAMDLNVFDHDFERALAHPAVALRQLGVFGLSPICHACDLVKLCGGGHFVHRYRAGAGFANPSVYCPDLFRLIEHIRQRVVADLRVRRERKP